MNVTITARGHFVVPQALRSTRCIRARFPELNVEVEAAISVDGRVSMPHALRSALTLPMDVEAELAAIDGPVAEASLMPLDGVVRFRASVARPKQHKTSVHVVVPASWARGMLRLGWHERVDAYVCGRRFIGNARRGVNDQVYLAIPRVEVPELVGGEEIAVELRQLVSPTAVTTGFSEQGIEWLAFAGERQAFMHERGLVFVNTRGHKIFVARQSPWAVAWLLGFYQAEGSKSPGGCEWTLANKSPILLSRVVADLTSLVGLQHRDISLSALYGTASLEDARERYLSVGVRMTGPPRFSADGHEFAGALHVGLDVKALFENVLARFMAMDDAIPVAASKAFGLGFLDGDGTITINDGNIRLGISGSDEETRIIHAHLVRGFDWPDVDLRMEARSHSRHRYLSIGQALDLLEAGVFWFSLSRVRLLHGIAEKVERITDIMEDRCKVPISTLQRWGYVDAERRVPETMRRARERFQSYLPELEDSRQLAPQAVTGRKGAENPLALKRYFESGFISPTQTLRSLDDTTRKRLLDAKVLLFASGGKDSTATGLYLRELGIPFESVFFDTGWEADETYAYLRHVLPTHLGDIRWLRGASGTLMDVARAHGRFPSRTARFCTGELKVQPAKAYVDKLRDEGHEVIQVVGIRARESESRSRLSEWDWSENFDCGTWRPIITWTEADVIDIHKRHGVAPNPLYLQGFERVGCFPCIYAKPRELVQIARIAPKRIHEIRQLEDALGSTFMERFGGAPAKIDEVLQEGERFVGTQADRGCMRWGLCETTAEDTAPSS